MAPPPYAGLQDILIKFATEWLKQRLEWYVRYQSIVQQLDGDVQNLLKVRDRVQNKVDEEESRYGKAIDVDVQNWLAGVDKIIPEYDKFHKDEDREYATCSICFLPKWGIRRRLSRSADGIAKQVAGLLQKTPSHDQFSHWHGPPSLDAVLLNVDYVSFESRKTTMNDIMAALEDWSVRMVGVHGWSGVGKTTLVKEVAKKARDDNLFNVVVMANVTRNPDIINIQVQIAEMLGMELEEKSDIARAARIRQRLKNEKQNTLIILDNLWAKLDFSLLGIPFANDDDDGKSLEAHNEKKAEKVPDASCEKKAQNLPDPHRKMKAAKLPSVFNETKTKETLSSYKGCKVLLISETIQVLMSQMDGKQKSIFSVEVLKEKEAEMLFKTMAGIGDNNSEFQKITAQISNMCEGLPMSIVTTARALKNQRRLVWEDVLRKLERQKLTGAPEFSIKLSYDLLENEELKFTFLLCASMGRDALIMDLVKYCIGLGILEGLYTVREARVRVLSLLAKLKESGLLSDSYSSDRFTMQDMVRRAALSISFVERHEFTMIKGKIDEWPDEDKLERYAVISLQHCDIIEDFPESINCPRLRVFQVDSNNPHLKIPDNFFKAMKELRVLILSGIHLSPLPSSIGCLTKLRLLCLERCMLGEQLCLIGELKNLRILSFSGSDIIELPGELNQLTKLQMFDISNCSKLAKIPFGVISSLISLEELYMRNTVVQWKVEGQPNQSENASLSELRHLNKLTVLDIKIPNVSCLPNNLFFDKLYSYKIVIGDLHAYSETDFKMPEKHEASRFLGLHLEDDTGIHSQKGIKILFDRVENLLLEKLSVKDIFYELNLKGFPYLKHLSIICNSHIQSLIKPKDRQHPEKAFSKLESLYLYNIKKMEEICSCTLSAPSFGKLKVIKIKLCGQLKNVFLISVVELLHVLETVEVSECNSLKEIVQSDTNEVKCLEFPKLRSLRLQSLSKFIGFYPISSEGHTGELFHEKVVLSELERMELSSIQINHIWSDKPSLSPNFQNLIHLDVIDCCNLKYLFSFSMAKRLVKLQSLSVSECGNMEHIFPQRQDRDTKTKDKVFPNLKNIKLTSMKSLSQIWNSELPFDSFGKVDTLMIEDCDKLVNVFPCYMVGIFQSLSNLRVTKCKKLKAIFDRYDQKQVVGGLTNLQDVYLEALPKLEHVWKWKIDQQGILNMRNLQKVWIGDCDSLKYIFPVFIDNCLKNLEYLGVWNCFGLEEIVPKGEHNNTNTNTSSPPLFEFPKLTTIKFSELPILKSFYSGARELSFPALIDLSLELCDKLKPFTKESANAEKRPLFPEEVVNNLKSIQIESWHAKSSSSYMGNYRRDNLEELQLSRLANTEILYSFLHSSPYLKSLSLNNCFFEELVSLERNHEIENLGVVPMLKSLKLKDLPNLEKIGFERDTVLQRIEFFILESCPCLVTIVPSSVSFSHLTNLEVVNCKGLINLMPPSTAKSLNQLSTMKVVNCESLKEIVSEQGIEEKNAGQIVFRQLEALELVSLENLKSFCSSESCVFEFPLLEKLVVNACPKMENFSQRDPIMPILQKMYVVHEKEKSRWYWEGDVKATIQKMYEKKYFFEGKGEFSFSDYQVLLQQASHGKVGLQNNWFYNLETLKLENCEIQPYAIPSNVLPYLKSLKKLEVRNCIKVEGIFDMHEETSFQLKKLTLEGLSNLTNVWRKNRQGILSFQNLQEVVVIGCDKLRMMFPAAIAKDLKKLEKLEIEGCNELLEIVGKEEAAAAESPIEVFVFPCLTSLDLNWLPQLTCFYPERFTLECPELNYLAMLDCAKLEVFQRQQEESDQGSTSNSISRQPLFSELNAISNLEVLNLQWRETSYLEVRFGQFREFLHLYNLWLFFDDDVNEKSTLPVKFLEKTPNLETMKLYDCGSLEIFPTHCEGDDRMLRHLKTLILQKVSELECIGSEESSWLNTICYNLHKLCVYSCPCLTTLVNSAVSLTNLKCLKIEECHGLEYLFTFSTAKKFTNLEEMHINECNSMKKIVKEEDETASEEVKFEWLEKITLESLPSLECFYSGNASSHLPSLINVVIRECPKMKFFSQRSIHVESFRGIQAFTNTNTELVFHDDLNTTVKWQSLIQENIVLSDYHELEDMWLGVVPLPVRSFSNMKSLVIDGCKFLSNAILPSHLLPFLKKLEVLEVKNCNSVEAIFDVKNTPTHYTAMGPASPIHLRLKKLTLIKLPNLKHVWNDDPQVIMSLPFLEAVSVDECKSIKSLFPASVATGILKTLNVELCEGLVEIVAKDEGAIEELTIFPSLTLLTLWKLPKLKCFYPGMHNQEWPMLTVLYFYECPLLKVFVTNFQNSADSHAEHQDCLPTEQHALISAGMVTHHLEQLSLNKEDVMMIEQGQHVNLNKLKILRLQCFHDESDVFPYVFFSKMPLPNVEKLQLFDSNFNEIFPSQRSDVEDTRILSQLNGLMLNNLSMLKSIGLEHSWMAPFTQGLEILNVLRCKCLRNLVPSTVSFTRLTHLIVDECHGLKYLFTSTTAKSLCLLTNMWVRDCKSLQEIVFEEAVEASSHDKGEIIFEHLNTLYFHSLPSLGRFYKGSCALKLPCLWRLLIIKCSEMVTFSEGTIIANKSLKIIFEEDADAVPLKVDLNFTIRNAFEAPANIVLGNGHELEDMWLGVVPLRVRSFSNVKSLLVEGCEFLTNAILPSHLLPTLKKLELLEVKNCNSVEAIFDVKDTPTHHTETGPASPLHLRLKKLTLEKLPNLKNVWNEDPQGSITSLTFLEEVFVEECENLKFLFPASEAGYILKRLDVKDCKELVEIVAKDEGTTNGANEELVIFPNLTSLKLWNLTNLKCFYPEMHNRAWPVLTMLDVYECPMLKVFVTNFQNCADSHPEHKDCLPTEQPALVSAGMVTHQFEELSLNKEDVMMIEQGQLHVNLKKLKSLRLQCFHDESDVYPYVFFSKVQLPGVEKLELFDSYFNELFPSQRSDIEDTKILSQLKELVLNYLPMLKSIGLEHSWMAPFTQGLEIFEVLKCKCLTNLVASTVSFSLLTQLTVKECHGLEYLFTSSTAKSLCLLTKMVVRDCKSLLEIVFEEAVEASSHDKGEIIFEHLNTLYFHSLPSLGRFYKGSCALNLPCLRRLSIIKCSMMVTFSEGTIIVNKYSKIKFEEDADAVPLKVDLNSTIRNAFAAPESLPRIERLEVDDSTLKEIVPSERPDVDDSKNILYQILKTLNVRSCKCLTNLVPSTVSFSHLTQLIVYNCDGLEYLLTSSTAKCFGVLEKMEIANCKSLKQIVAKEGNEADENEIIFEHLNTLSLRSLTRVRKFYDGSCALSFPSLWQLSVIHCRRMVTFSEGTIIANKLSKVKFEENADDVPLEGGLNSTIWNAFEALEYLVLGDYHELDDVWLGVVPVPDRSFSNLKSLVVKRCDFLSKAILPSHLLPFLRKLEELKVQKCNSVEAIFDVKDTKMGPASPLHLGLKKMILKDLPNLKHVWNEDPQLIISLPFLEAVSVVGCKSIKSLFPASVAKGILKTLDVRRCDGLMEIVAKDEGAIEELTIFPSLTSLTLWNLPKLKCFYPGMQNQEWPMLTVLDFYKCPMLKVFVTEFQNYPDSQTEGEDCLPINQQALISADKVTSHLEELSLNKEDVIMIEQGQVHVDLLKLKYLKLQFFNDELDVFPYVFLSKVPLPCIERLEVGDSTLKEIFPTERPDVDDTKILSQLKGLELNYLPMLKSIGLEHFWIAPFTERLKTLNVRSCKCLTNLVSSTVSFSHLTVLIVDLCHGLEYLFTSSTAKSLGVLEKMEIANCKSLKQIVEDEQAEEEPPLKNNVEDEQEKDEPDQDEAKDDEPVVDEMIFGNLEILSLSSLPRLESFYTGSSALKFPSLVKVSFTECDNMKMFCHGDIAVPKNLEGKIDGVHWSGVINTAINLS